MKVKKNSNEAGKKTVFFENVTGADSFLGKYHCLRLRSSERGNRDGEMRIRDNFFPKPSQS
jgi:hypothetical protein